MKLTFALFAVTLPVLHASAASSNEQTDDWRKIATKRDEARLDGAQQSWPRALADAKSQSPEDYRRVRTIAIPEAALSRPQPTPGNYRCRTVKFVTGVSGALAYPWFRCRVTLSPGGNLLFEKITGSQKPRGLLYPHSKTSLVFLGSLGLGSQRGGRYGEDPETDQTGFFQRIGRNHYRLVLPEPIAESRLDIFDIRR